MTERRALRIELATALLREGRAVELPLGGRSMRPLLVPPCSVRVDPTSAAEVRAGDVVVLDLGERLLCHRLVYKTADRVITRGDDCFADDDPLPLDAVVGRVDVPPSPRALLCAIRALLRF